MKQRLHFDFGLMQICPSGCSAGEEVFARLRRTGAIGHKLPRSTAANRALPSQGLNSGVYDSTSSGVNMNTCGFTKSK